MAIDASKVTCKPSTTEIRQQNNSVPHEYFIEYLMCV
jgi:hypothetical protein